MVFLVNNIFSRLIGIFGVVGKFIIFFFNVLYNFFSFPFYTNIFFYHLFKIGFASLFLVAVTSFFSGGVLALHTYSGIGGSYSSRIVPEIVALSIVQELGPVLVGLLVTGRIVSSMTAEIAAMRVTEQIDALFVLSTNPIKYLIVTRVFAGIISLPFLVFIGNIIGIIGGLFVCVVKFDMSYFDYILSTKNVLKYSDVFYSMVKALVFSLIMSFISCFNGFFVKGGAQGVGKATINSVVLSSVLILVSNYIITFFLFVK